MRPVLRRHTPAYVLVAGLASLALALSACSSNAGTSTGASPSGSASAPAGQMPKIGLVMKSLSNEFFKQMEAGAQSYADKHTADFKFTSVGMRDERDFAAQVDAVDTFIADKYDIIVVAPADSKAMVAPLKRAMEAGLTVINIDVPLDQATMKSAGVDLPFFGPDNVEGARLVGDALAKKLGDGGKVIILEGNPEADNAKQRKAGFEAAVKAGGLKLLASETAHWETEEANTLTANLLNRYPDVQGIMAANDSMALGAVKALAAVGRSNNIKVIGFDNIPPVKALLDQGKMLATVEQFGADMAVFGIQYGLKTRGGEKFKGWTKTPIKLVVSSSAG